MDFNSLLNNKLIDRVCKNYKTISISLVCISLIGGVYLIVNIFFYSSNIYKELDDISSQKIVIDSIDIIQLKDKEYYKSKVKSKNVFHETRKIEEVKEPTVSYDFIDNFKLKGIMSGVLTKAIIEDSSTGRTYLVGEGERFRGVRVDKIDQGMVIISYEGREFRLDL